MSNRMLALLGAFLLAGCMTIGTRFTVENVTKLEPGVSTYDDAVRLLGPPTSASDMGNGTRLMQWQYSRGTLVGGSGAHAAILFDRNGRMIKVTHLTKV